MARHSLTLLCSALLAVTATGPAFAIERMPAPAVEATYFNLLREKFPDAFGSYRDPSWIFLTDEAIWTKDGDVLPFRVTIEAQKTALGHRRVRADDQVSIESEYAFDRRARRVDLERVFLAPQFSPAYAWRILIAEFMIKYEKIDRFRVTLDSADAATDVASCGDLLAEGYAADSAYLELPITRAMIRFGFELVGGDVFEHAAEGESDAHYPGQLTIDLEYRRRP